MKFIVAIRIVQALRVSSVIFGVLGAAAAATACNASPPADDTSSPEAKEALPAVGNARNITFKNWETSGGASGEGICSSYNKDMTGSGTSDINCNEQFAIDEAEERAKDDVEKECEDSSGTLCRATPENTDVTGHNCWKITTDNHCVQGWRCRATAETHCTYSLF